MGILQVIEQLTGLKTNRATVCINVAKMKLREFRKSSKGILYVNELTNSYIAYHKEEGKYYSFRLN